MMTRQAVYANALPDGSGTLASTTPSLALTPTSEASTTAFGLPDDYYSRGSWRWQHDMDNTGTSATPGAERNRRASPSRRATERVVGLRRWEGRILEISDGLLTVELIPSDHEGPDLVADFNAELLGPDSISVVSGDIVYLTTRTVRDATGYPYQTSSLKLRRPGPWDEQELREIQAVAKEQADFFKGID